MKDKKAAKLIIKRAKQHPDWYSTDDVKYAKMVKRRIKQEKNDQKIIQQDRQEGSRRDLGMGGNS